MAFKEIKRAMGIPPTPRPLAYKQSLCGQAHKKARHHHKNFCTLLPIIWNTLIEIMFVVTIKLARMSRLKIRGVAAFFQSSKRYEYITR
ncbi:MAG: hypothetical protein JRI89_08945 [Deltaproteobacteria bacterium]|nr:hypothetical protein [Deltaproteobacteria bacterium]